MRNTTFIASMVLSVACVSAANAGVIPGFVSIDDFSIEDSVSPTTNGGYTYSAGSSSLQDPYVSQAYGAATSRNLLGASRNSNGFKSGSVSVANQSMTMSYGGTPTTGSTRWYNSANSEADPASTVSYSPYSETFYSYQTSTAIWGAFGGGTAFGGHIDMSGITEFSFDLSAYATTGTLNTPKMYLRLLTWDASENDYVQGVHEIATLGNGHVDVAASNFAGQDFSAVYQVELVFTNTTVGTTGLNFLNAGVAPPTGTVTVSNFGFNAVPAPGALALLGAAGLIGARRRRA